MTALWPVRTALAILARISPGLAAQWALDIFFTPKGRPRARRAQAFLAKGRRLELRAGADRVVGWAWGQGPTVYLVHGWAGVGGQLAAFGPPLLASGFRVVAFDAPGHGASTGRHSSIVHFARALRALSEREGEAHAVLAHSFGAAATAYAISQGLRVRRAVFIGPAAGPWDWAQQFREQLGLPNHVMDRMRARSEAWLGASWDEFDVPRLGRGQTTPLLVIHDRDDVEVPWKDGAAIAAAWPGAQLLTTAGLGHRRTLWDPRVIQEAVSFVKGEGDGHSRTCSRAGCKNPRGEGELCESCDLELSLYVREGRRGWGGAAGGHSLDTPPAIS